MDVALTGDFWSQAIYRCHWNLHQTNPSCHGNENVKFKSKINHNAANIRHRAKHVAPIGGLSRSGNLTMPLKFTPGRPRCHGNENRGILTQNFLFGQIRFSGIWPPQLLRVCRPCPPLFYTVEVRGYINSWQLINTCLQSCNVVVFPAFVVIPELFIRDRNINIAPNRGL